MYRNQLLLARLPVRLGQQEQFLQADAAERDVLIPDLVSASGQLRAAPALDKPSPGHRR